MTQSLIVQNPAGKAAQLFLLLHGVTDENRSERIAQAMPLIPSPDTSSHRRWLICSSSA